MGLVEVIVDEWFVIVVVNLSIKVYMFGDWVI